MPHAAEYAAALSPALLAAQARLLQLREQVTRDRPHQSAPVKAKAAASITPSLAERGQALLLARRQHEAQLQGAQASDALKAALRPTMPEPDSTASSGRPDDAAGNASPVSRLTTGTSTVTPQTHRVYPSMATAILAQGQASPYRVWLLCRALDVQGRGWVPLEQVKARLTRPDAAWRLFSWRRLRQLLTQGQEKFWQWDKAGHRLWLRGAATVASAFGVSRLQGRAVILPHNALVESIGTFRAHLYAAFHSGRRQSRPMARATQRRVLGVPESTQRHYCRKASIPRQTNIAIGARSSPEKAQETAYQRGRGTFTFIDSHGRQGRKNGRYVAWQLPTTHLPIHAVAPTGRQRKINRQLSDLVNPGAQGNGELPLYRRYHAHSAAAGQGARLVTDATHYWPRQPQPRGSQLWHAITLAH